MREGHLTPNRGSGPEAKARPIISEVDDALQGELEPVLRVEKVREKPSRPRSDDRAIFDGLLWLARTGSKWSELPSRERGVGAGLGGAAPGVRPRDRPRLGVASGGRVHREGPVRQKGRPGEAESRVGGILERIVPIHNLDADGVERADTRRIRVRLR